MENASWEGIFQLLLLLVIVVPLIYFMLTLQNTLKVVEPQHRTMQPGNVWFMLIPIFSFVWSFFVVAAIADSCKAQLEQYGLYSQEKPTYKLGTAWALCLLFSIVVRLLSIVSLILFIVYWIKVNELRKQLLALKQVYENNDDGSVL